MKRLLLATVAFLAVFNAGRPAHAEDIDLFMQPPGDDSSLPNVLILLDNTANWNTPFEQQMLALSTTVDALPVNDDGSAKFRLGLMLFTESGGDNKGDDGGYVRVAIRDLDEDFKDQFVALIESLEKNPDKGNAVKGGKTMAEVYQYFSGLAPYTGNKKVKTDYTGNDDGSPESNDIYALDGNALAAYDGSPYNSPIVDDSCAGNFLIYISNGQSTENNADSTQATNRLIAAAAAAGISGATTTIPISPSGLDKSTADEWARFMKKSPRAITTYTIDVKPLSTGLTPAWTAVLRSMAGISGGKYFDAGDGSNGALVAEALGRIFSEIQAVNSVFASVSLPVSVNTEGTYLNQVYIGMFRPDQDGLPRWAGNLKQYKLGIVSNALRTLDADGNSAINSSTGFITECARSFWTPTTADSYWAFRPQGGCTISSVNYDSSNYPDGKIVEKGAQAYVLRSNTARVVRTCSSVFASCSTAGALIDFATANVSKASLGNASMTNADQTMYVNWMRGLDTEDEDIDGIKDLTTPAEIRPSAHGDIVHSRPIAINYGTDVAPKVVVYYGGNEGVLRAVNGNRTAAIGSVTAGKEIWSFVPPEFFGSISRIKDNKVQIDYKGMEFLDDAPDPLPKPYGMDGPITAYNNNSLYVGMRRGGRALYAFNVTGIVRDAADGGPVEPRMLWKVGCPNLTNDDDCTTGFDDIGQTWSAAKVMKTMGYVVDPSATIKVPKPMLIFGGGYDSCEDADPASEDCRDDGKGHRIYVVDAATGAPLKEFDTLRGVVGDVFVVSDRVRISAAGVVPEVYEERAKWAYAADLGGNVYRISGNNDPNAPLGDSAPSTWRLTRIAALGCDEVGDCDENRKFMFMPDILQKGDTYYLLLGSGDREKPLLEWPSAYGTDNYFFMITDRPTDVDWLESEDGNCESAVMCMDSLLEIGGSDPDPTALAEKKGWYLLLNDHEQVVTSAITVFGTTTFSTHTPAVPTPGSCVSTLGTARVYNIRFLNASARVGEERSAEISGGGLPPSPVAGLVTLDDGTTVPFIIGADADSPLESKLPESPSTGTQPKSLTYWYLEK
jgi:type IV pilus assembly protein PilY1